MGKTKHEESFVDFDRGYEQNTIGMRGIIYFAAGLFLLIVVTFGLMWALQNLMESDAARTKDSNNPLRMTEKERLPPEPRLQAAPGFGVESPKGYVNLELKAPQSEWREIHEQYEKLWRDGQRDEATGTVVTLPIDEAKEKLVQQAEKAVAPAGAATPAATGGGEDALTKSQATISDSSAGRLASEKRR